MNTWNPFLHDEGLKEKKKQRLFKARFSLNLAGGHAARNKRRSRISLLKSARTTREQAADPSGLVAHVRAEHASVMERIKERNRRKGIHRDGKSAASQPGMKSILLQALLLTNASGKGDVKEVVHELFVNGYLLRSLMLQCVEKMFRTGLSIARL
jgi:hypothetical protein